MNDIAVLIPCYNEATSIQKVICDFRAALPDAAIYVYDNNSTDGTDDIARQAGAIVRYEHQQGKGSVVRRMFQEIEAKCYIADIRDIMTGYRAMSYRFVKSFPVVSQGFEIETEMTIHAVDKNMGIVNHVVNYRDRSEGSTSKLRTIPDGLKVLRTILRLFSNYEPLKFFGLLAVILAVLSLGFFLPVLNDYMHMGLVERFPTLIVCGFTMIAAMNLLFAGLILHALKHKERREFEFRLQEIHPMAEGRIMIQRKYRQTNVSRSVR